MHQNKKKSKTMHVCKAFDTGGAKKKKLIILIALKSQSFLL